MTKFESDILKGVSITSVGLIHALAIFQPHVWLSGSFLAHTIIFLDQVARFSIPLFILISWYGLQKKYETKPLEFKKYLWERVSKLLPLYLLWSLLLFVILPLSPRWTFAAEVPLLSKLLVGQADYHLYFVPLIFLFYVLFPVFRSIPKKWLLPTTILIFCMQLAWYWWLTSVDPSTKLFNLQPDQWQYLLPLSWLWYGWLGLLLARNQHDQRIGTLSNKLLVGILSSIGLATAILQTNQYLIATQDVLGGLKFTRLEVIFYATFMSIFLISQVQQQTSKFSQWLAIIGKYSFLIYLAHTMVIRLVTFPFEPLFDLNTWLIGFVSTITITLLSWWLIKQR
jgi:surface polysaccharide O-acyltransferase-like enzyme